ncbi:stability/partitioning determinant [Rhizobium rosettiformans W3]|nr:stability/partitioning determinant [Rhizobium rosettiformans W3]
MATRPSLGFEDDDLPDGPVTSDLDDLSVFQPKSPPRPDRSKIEQAAARSSFTSREAAKKVETAQETPLAKPVRRYRTGRSAQLNLKVRPETIEQFYGVADANGWVLGEAFEKAVALLEAKYKPR